MKKGILICTAAVSALLALTSCNVTRTGSREENSHATVAPEIVSYNELTMDLDPEGVTYTIDISTPEGKLFNPQFTHLKKGKDILRVTVFGFPARYKRIDNETDMETETVEEKRTEGGREVTTQKKTTLQKPATNRRRTKTRR